MNIEDNINVARKRTIRFSKGLNWIYSQYDRGLMRKTDKPINLYDSGLQEEMSWLNDKILSGKITEEGVSRSLDQFNSRWALHLLTKRVQYRYIMGRKPKIKRNLAMLDLRKKGYTYREIASIFKIDVSLAHRIVKKLSPPPVDFKDGSSLQ